ncbi:DUF3678 domain-containing protein [Reyranella sp. CPCC 100927]|nr:DUF3678 domain-containing protein [Reyranella sp. CPCC 100927]
MWRSRPPTAGPTPVPSCSCCVAERRCRRLQRPGRALRSQRPTERPTS